MRSSVVISMTSEYQDFLSKYQQVQYVTLSMKTTDLQAQSFF